VPDASVDLFAPGPTRIMGIVNVTPDSFSDGGRWVDPEAAVEHGRRLAAQGADLIDVGGESTRPGSVRTSPQEELDRVLPVVRTLAEEGHRVSVDTMRAQVAAEAVRAGAVLVNDVSGGLADDEMAGVVAREQVAYVAMHWRGLLTDPGAPAHYDDVVAEVCAELADRVQVLTSAGVRRERIVLDPGFGFAKDATHNWTLLGGLERLRELGQPVLVGASRKRFLGRLPTRPGHGPSPESEPTAPSRRDVATAATSLLAAQAGAWAVRVHQVGPTRDALGVWEMVRRAG
jgi:dihydropteroate synthase